MDFYADVPKDLKENLKYRIALRKQAERSSAFRRAMIEACRHDVLFWLSTACWLHEPRPVIGRDGKPLPEIIPFIPWPHQEPIIRTLRAKLGFESIGIEKARGEGMSWILVYMALHDCIFAKAGTRLVSIGLCSRNMDFGDTPDDMASLGAKIDWALRRLPKWMAGNEYKIRPQTGEFGWKRHESNHTWRFVPNGSMISIYAATAEVGSGGRYTWFGFDELAKFPAPDDKKALTSTQATTNSRLYVSTPLGSEGAYADIMHEPSSMIKLVLTWEDNPTRNRGLYRFVQGRPVAINPVHNPLPHRYNPPNQEIQDLFARLRKKGFRLEKGVRSSWYDKECDRELATPYSIAQELDRDYGGSQYKIFQEDFFRQAQATVRHPICRVDVDYDVDLEPTITRSMEGALHLWMTLDTKNRPPKHPYIVSDDLCSGVAYQYSSNSVLEIIDALEMEQVGELIANNIEPDDFADLSIAVCKWLGGALLAWERNGPGIPFTRRVLRAGYPHIFYHPQKMLERRSRKGRKLPGWHTDQKTKQVLFSEMKRIVSTAELKLRSKELVAEFHHYVAIGRSIEYDAVVRGGDLSPDAKDGHGDRVMALGVGVQALKDRPVAPPPEPSEVRDRERDFMDSQQVHDDWDDRTNWDLMHGRAAGSIR